MFDFDMSPNTIADIDFSLEELRVILGSITTAKSELEKDLKSPLSSGRFENLSYELDMLNNLGEKITGYLSTIGISCC